MGFEEIENEDGDIEQVEVTREGQVYKFPFDTEKKDYEQWDSELGEATTAKYDGEEELEGIDGLQVRADHRADRDRHPRHPRARSSAPTSPPSRPT